MGDRARRRAGWWARFVAGCTLAGSVPTLVLTAPSCGGDAFTTGGGAADAAAVDVGTINPEAGAPDRGLPPPPKDGGSPHPDGSLIPDVATIDAAAPGWCGGHPGHTFCEDFDEYQNVNTLFSSWSSFEQMNGNFKLDVAGAPSPPNALEAIGASGAKVIVLKTLPVTVVLPTKLRLEFDLRINSPGSVGFLSAVGVAAIAFGSSITDGFAALAIGSGPTLAGAWVDAADGGTSDAGTFQTSNASGTFPASGVWAGRYAIEVDYSANTNGCVQIYDGVTALLPSCLVLPAGLRHPKTVSVVLGDYAAGLSNTGSIDVEFDDVTFDLL